VAAIEDAAKVRRFEQPQLFLKRKFVHGTQFSKSAANGPRLYRCWFASRL
jgi:hypothetical protein